MFTLLYQAQCLKWVAPAAFMLGTAPNFYVLWGAWRAMTAILPTRVYQTGDDFLYSLYQRLVLFFFENYSGVEIVLYGDAEKLKQEKENVILLCNHQSTMDWVIADMLAVRQGSIGHIRYILKDGLRYFPMYGMYFKQHSCIYVKRSGKFKQDQAQNQLDEIVKTNIPFWMVVFPEGTRHNDKTLAKSKSFAEKKGLPSFNYVLTPRQKALQLCVERLRSKADAVYDVTIAYSNTTDPESKKRIDAPGLAEFMMGQTKQLHILIRRVDLSGIPEDEEKMSEWLTSSFKEKDKLLKRFYAGDEKSLMTLGDDGVVDPLSLKHTLPAFLFWLGVNTPVLITPEGRSYYWKSALLGTLIGWTWMAIRS